MALESVYAHGEEEGVFVVVVVVVGAGCYMLIYPVIIHRGVERYHT